MTDLTSRLRFVDGVDSFASQLLRKRNFSKINMPELNGLQVLSLVLISDFKNWFERELLTKEGEALKEDLEVLWEKFNQDAKSITEVVEYKKHMRKLSRQMKKIAKQYRLEINKNDESNR